MTTPRDLLIVVMDSASPHTVDRGDLSLALAGAEMIDLLDARAVRLDGERIVPGYRPAVADHLLDGALSSLVREDPHEPVGEWLWRRGRGLSAEYLAALEAEGQLVRRRRHRWPLVPEGETTLVDSPARYQAADRWAADEPVLVALAWAVGVGDGPAKDSPGIRDAAVATVLSAVDDALGELAAERGRRSRRREEAAADNVRRGY